MCLNLGLDVDAPLRFPTEPAQAPAPFQRQQPGARKRRASQVEEEDNNAGDSEPNENAENEDNDPWGEEPGDVDVAN